MGVGQKFHVFSNKIGQLDGGAGEALGYRGPLLKRWYGANISWFSVIKLAKTSAGVASEVEEATLGVGWVMLSMSTKLKLRMMK